MSEKSETNADRKYLFAKHEEKICIEIAPRNGGKNEGHMVGNGGGWVY